MRSATLVAFVSLASAALAANFNLVKDYSGTDFFNDWTYYGHFDDLNNGNVIYVNQSDSSSLTFVNPQGHAIIKVDNTTNVPVNFPRDSVRITTNDFFEIGTIFVIDAVHMPFGCSVWPSIWTKGNPWPQLGEIDIIEGVNLMNYNQMALHTTDGCTAAPKANMTGTTLLTDCAPVGGCTVKENTPNSYGQAFATNGGGVWAAQFDISGIFIWFWQRSDVPASITSATSTLDISTWGPPSASYPSGVTCNITNFFGAQQMVIDITLCGDWAGLNTTYAQTCGNSTNNACYLTNVPGSGANYADAYFELSYIRAFAASNSSVVTSSATTGNTPTSISGSGAAGASATVTTTAGSGGNGTSGGATTGKGVATLAPSVVVSFAVGVLSFVSLLAI